MNWLSMHVFNGSCTGNNVFGMILACNEYGMVGYKSDMELV